MEPDRDYFCLICRENDGEFLTRCNHRYHLDCLSVWFKIPNKEKCPLCRGPISQIQLLEDIIANRSISESLFEALSLQPVDKKVIQWGFEYQNVNILSEVIRQGVDLIIPAFELKQLDFLKEFLEKELVDSFDNKYITKVRKQLKIAEYVLEKEKQSQDTNRIRRDPSIYYFQTFDLQFAALLAARYGHFDIVQYFSDLGIRSSEIILNAVRGGHLEIVKYMTGKVPPDEQLYADRARLIEAAIESGNIDVLKYLISQGLASHNGVKRAAGNGHFEMVKLLLQMEMNETCLYDAVKAAAAGGHLTIIKYLMDKCENDYSEGIIDIAALNGHAEIVKYLVRIGKPFSDYAFKCGYENGNLEIVKCLVENGHPSSSEALDFAIKNGFLEIVKYLLEKGISCTSEAFKEAGRNGSNEIIGCLLQYEIACSADVIDAAAGAGHFETVQLLIEKRKNFTINAIEGAARSDHLEIIKYLVKHEDLLIPRSHLFHKQSMYDKYV